MSGGKPRICFVAHNALGELAGGHDGHVGGVERQISLMARWFAADGCSVCVATWGEPFAADSPTGVDVIDMCRRDEGLWGVRFFHPRWTSLVAALRRADADVYYHNCGEYVTGQVALWCRRHGRKFVYSVANDTDCDPALPQMRSIRERVLYRYGLRRADAVVSQTLRQQAMLREGFARPSVVVPMPCPGPSPDEYIPPRLDVADPPRVLWIGRICLQKRPDRLLDIAEACPAVEFDLVGPCAPDQYAQAVCRRARAMSNVTVHGKATRRQVGRFYRRSACMCSTSDFEGFPNTFLEAWSHGLPLISTFDPDGQVAANGMGIIAEQTDALVAAVGAVLSEKRRYRRLSDRAREYYLRMHTVDTVMPRFRNVFAEVLNRRWW